ncbi:MAG: hypothetical protein E7265_10280 [Lachnospiraceae bacterium]|nr:hypothetical protein [Lachnospiraceae bacterium]
MKPRNDFMKAVVLCIGDLKRLVKSPKIYLIIILTLFFFDNFVMDIKSIAASVKIGITPFVYPILMSGWQGRMLVLLVIVVLMSDAPFYSGTEKNVFLRVSKYSWICSKVIYVFVLSVVYQILCFAASIIVCAPYIAMGNEWGTAIKTYAYGISNGISAGSGEGAYVIVSCYSPLEALVKELVIALMVSVIIGLLIMTLNILFNGYAGTVIASVVVILDAFLESFITSSSVIHKILSNLPTVWVSLSGLSQGDVKKMHSFGSACLICVIIIFVLLLSLFLGTKVRIEKIREK